MKHAYPMKPRTRLNWIEYQMANLIAHKATGGATPTHEDHVVIKCTDGTDDSLAQILQSRIHEERGSLVPLKKCIDAHKSLITKGVLWVDLDGPKELWEEGFTAEGYDLWAKWADDVNVKDNMPTVTDEDKALEFLKTQDFFAGISEEQRRTLVKVLTAPQEHNLFKSFCYAALFKS